MVSVLFTPGSQHSVQCLEYKRPLTLLGLTVNYCLNCSTVSIDLYKEKRQLLLKADATGLSTCFRFAGILWD